MAIGVTYSSRERATAEAIVDEMILRGVGVGGGGGISDATAANQLSEIARLDAINGKLPLALVNGRLVVDPSGVTQPISAIAFGNTNDAVATTDTGIFSLIALIKRLLSIKLPSALSNDRLKTESFATVTARTTSFLNTSTTGTIAAGASSVTIANAGGAAGTVKTVSLPANSSISFSANGNDILDEISYSATGTTFLITTMV